MSADKMKMCFRTWFMMLILIGASLGLATPAVAQSCYVNGAFGMNFGTVGTSGRAATSQLTYTCAPDYSGANQTYYYQICIYIGPGDWSAGQPTRRMSNYNGAFLNYDLFADPARAQIIGAPGTTPVYRVYTAVPPGSPVTANASIYGWVYPGQSVPAVQAYQEQSHQGLIRYRYATNGFPNSEDCTVGGIGGGSVGFGSSGVLATYENSCTIVVTDLDFGPVPPPQTSVYATSSIRVQCAPGTTWKLGLDNGQHYDGIMRRMAGAGGYVKYQLYIDESRTNIWGNDAISMVVGTTDVTGSSQTVTVYGAVPPQPDASGGFYADTIIATLYY
jgi:spore coat protein U-like protein